MLRATVTLNVPDCNAVPAIHYLLMMVLVGVEVHTHAHLMAEELRQVS